MSRRGGLMLAMFTTAAFVWPSSAARAAPTRDIAVVVREVGTRDRSAIETAVSEELGRYPDLRLRDISGTAANRIDDCKVDLACVANILAEERFDLGIVLAVVAQEERISVAIEILDADSQQTRVRHFGTIDPNTRSTVVGISTELGAALNRIGYVHGGRLILTVKPPDAIVRVDDKASGDVASIFVLTPGRHHIEATHPDHESKRVEVDVFADQDVHVDLALDPESSVFASPWLWLTVGVAVAAGVVTAVAVAPRPQALTFCQVPQGATCTGR